MASLLDITDKKGRINHNVLKDFISHTALSDFAEQAQRPFLIGKELYDGELHKKIGDQASGTMKFQVAEIKGLLDETLKTMEASPGSTDSGGISHAIYYLRKKNNGITSEEQDTFYVGRSEDNDIVIADYAISKRHAEILFYRDMYFAVDLKSTNGTKVNQQPIGPGMKIQLPIGSTISFGRFCFIFTHPLQLYRGMR